MKSLSQSHLWDKINVALKEVTPYTKPVFKPRFIIKRPGNKFNNSPKVG